MVAIRAIAPGNNHQGYAFGCKVSVVVINKSNWVVGIKASHGNSYDGHTLAGAVSNKLMSLTSQTWICCSPTTAATPITPAAFTSAND